MLTNDDKKNILNEFPNIKLSYENIIYKKVSNSETIIAIPEGKKCFAWFKSYNEKNSCFIMELSGNKQIEDIRYTQACFSNELCYGTIFYGTVFNYLSNRFFTVEDIFYYKGSDISRENWGNKLIKLYQIFSKDLNQTSYNRNYIVFGLPLICKTNEELENKIKNIKYKIDKIQFRLYSKTNNYLFMEYNNYTADNHLIKTKLYNNTAIHNNNTSIHNNNTSIHNNNTSIHNNNTSIHNKNKNSYKKECVFLIRPDIQDDIYYLYYLNNDFKEEQYSVAHIPDYNTSVMMNKLFRIIKENINLDALEESDDEDEFETSKIDKFVKLDISYKMV